MGSPEKKVVLKLDLHDDKAKQKALKAVSTVSGIDSISMDMKGKKMTVIGVADPVTVVSRLRKSWRTEILSIGPAKEPPKPEEKKEEPKKEEPKKEEPKPEEKKDEAKKEEPKKEEPNKEEKKEEPKEEAKKEEKKEEPKKEAEKKDPSEQLAEFIKIHRLYNPYMTNPYPYMTNPYMPARYAVQSVEEDPNQCAIL